MTGADLFCGAGGTTTGLLRAAGELNLRMDILAVNHWNVAIDTHTRNHPHVRHLCESLDGVDPRKAIPSGKLDILCASPECTHHSNARGGKPRADQSRATAWHILRWAEALRIENILIENVREFQHWGPLTKMGKPMKRKRGDTFRAFIAALRSLDYQVEWKILNAANYGDPTTRQRLFILARRGKAIKWPVATHAAAPVTDKLRWEPARKIIDWQIKGASIFDRKKPLSENTLRRIMAGLKKFGGAAFILPREGFFRGNQPRSVDDPLPTLTSRGDQTKLVEPFIVHLRGTQDGQLNSSARSVDQPLPALTTSGAHCALCEPFLIHTTHHGKRPGHSVEQPLPTVTCAKRGEMALIEPFLINYHNSHAGRSDGDNRSQSVDNPIPSLDTSNRLALIEPFLVKYYGSGDGAEPLTEPLDTVTGRDRFGLVEPETHGARLDIRFRMLQPHELSRAMSFPDDYQFAGTRESQVKQIGNAVPVRTAAALCKALLT